MSCGFHGNVLPRKNLLLPYAWVGNYETQCPGQCTWPFHQTIYGPQTPPLVARNGDMGINGMIINITTILAGAVTNPFNNGYFQGDKGAPLQAVFACRGMYGTGFYLGFPGNILVDKTTGASYNGNGVNGHKFLLPTIWDPSTCGWYGTGSYSGFPSNILVVKTIGVSYNGNGVNGRKFLLPTIWDPSTRACKTLV